MPTAVGRGLGRLGLQGGVMTAARLSSLTSLHRQATIEILMTVDRIVALAPWVRQVLAENGVTAEKIVDCPHGVAAVPVPPPGTRTGEIRIAHLGRLHPTKGTELLVDAMRGVRSSRLGLDIFGIAQGGDGEAMAARIAAAAAADPRIRLHAAIDSADVPAALSAYDAVAVPSQWMETGPLVVLEAFASGTPVLGSDLGGIADKVTHGLNGLLVSPCGSTRAWTEALEQCASDDGLLARLRQGVSRPRSQRAVAREMAGLYAAVTSRAGRTADAPGAA
jgi:glycosyltransferase involved in cell wall biosynthesis